ncbi:MAG: sugar ABC transporter substrate-binding protein [Chloroflexota bacterium]
MSSRRFPTIPFALSFLLAACGGGAAAPSASAPAASVAPASAASAAASAKPAASGAASAAASKPAASGAASAAGSASAKPAASSAASAGGSAAAKPAASASAPIAAVTSGGKKIALLLPESKTARYESKDRPLFEARVKAACTDCQVLYSNANQDASQQQSQAEAAMTNGASVLVLDAVDGAAAAVIATRAAAQKIPVISYDRLITGSAGVSYYISFDNLGVGKLQGTSLLQALSAKQNPAIVMINGAPTDNNAKLFKQGAHSVLDGKVTIAKEYDTPDWSPDQAQNEMSQALTALNNKVDGVYAANDGTAGGAIAALKAAGVSPLPPVTGQDAEVAGIQRIVTGDQYMTVYKAIKPEAEAAADMAVDLAVARPVPSDLTKGATTNNGAKDVPSVLLTPIAVTKSNIASTVIADGFWTRDQICTGAIASACTSAGL